MRSRPLFPSLCVFVSLLSVFIWLVTGAPIQAGPSAVAPSAAFAVTNLLDSGVGSLRWAVQQANSLPGADTITISANLTTKGTRRIDWQNRKCRQRTPLKYHKSKLSYDWTRPRRRVCGQACRRFCIW